MGHGLAAEESLQSRRTSHESSCLPHMKIVTAAQMRDLDRQAIDEYHIPSLILTEHAALRVVEVLEARHGPLGGQRITVVCGPGKNGEDGLAIARQLSCRHVEVSVGLAGKPGSYSGDAAIYLKMLEAYRVQILDISHLQFAQTDVIVDALYGTGIEGPVTGAAAEIIHLINQSGRPVLAVDIPSGLPADTGIAAGPVVRATTTVTFAFPKFGLLQYPGAAATGELVIADICLPTAIMQASSVSGFVTQDEDVTGWLTARTNSRDANKGTYGHVVVIGGSNGMIGAPIMSAEAAARTGAGLVTLAVPGEIQPSVMARVSPAIMTRGLRQSTGMSLSQACVEQALDITQKATVCALGTGIGQSADAAGFIRDFIRRCPIPLVIDADALDLLAQDSDRGESAIRVRTAMTILTPHPGEMGRLLGISVEAVQADRRGAVTRAAQAYGCVVLLKGARSLIASPDGVIYLNRTGNPGMATGGTGDVLTGVLAALIAQGLPPLAAAAAGAHLHGQAGDLARQTVGGMTGMIATDLLSQLPRAIALCHPEANQFQGTMTTDPAAVSTLTAASASLA